MKYLKKINKMINELLFSDDDEEIVEYIATDFFNRTVAERSVYFNALRDKAFHIRFRLQKETVVVLLDKIKTRIESTKWLVP